MFTVSIIFIIFYRTVPKTEKPLSYEEKLILERNAKRRRTKYKAVHTNKKSYTEVMREVIDGQMKLYEEWCSGNIENVDTERPNKIDNEKSSAIVDRHADFEQNQYKKYSRKIRHKTRDDSNYRRHHHSHHRN